MGKQKIDPEAWYTLSDLVRLNLFPFCGTDIRRYRAAVKSDMKGPNHLKTSTRGKGMGVRYLFLGSNIISYIKCVEAGTAKL